MLAIVENITYLLHTYVRNSESLVPIIGVNGAQGSGKTTITRQLQQLLQTKYQLKAVIVSLDDFYQTKQERQYLARTIHPLLETRGVPGTHDVALLNRTLTELQQARAKSEVVMPVFSKALDDRLPPGEWSVVKGVVDVILFEGWCVGCEPQNEAELLIAVNRLEEQEDSKLIWRHYVNTALTKAYHQLFQRLDYLIMLQISDFALVYQHRLQQEHDLQRQVLARASRAGEEPMSDAEVRRFVEHYQRLTEHMLHTLPAKADILVQVDANHIYRLVKP